MEPESFDALSPGYMLSPYRSTTRDDVNLRAIRDWSEYYIHESFKVRPCYLGSIEQHPDFE